MTTIESLRQKIDDIDNQLLMLLSKRLQTAQKIVSLRTSFAGTTRDPQREQAIIHRLTKQAQTHNLAPSFVSEIWQKLFALSYTAHQQPIITANPEITVAIVGFGRFGQLLHRLITTHCENVRVLVHTAHPDSHQHPTISFIPTTAINQADVVVLAVPISKFEPVVKEISPHLKQTCLVIDICTVKVHPVKVMQQNLPKTVSILATHPMWGPDSVRINNGLEGLTIVLTPIRASALVVKHAHSLCQQVGLVPLELSPEQHDQWLAESLLTTDLVGLLLKEMSFASTPIDTISATWLHKLVDEFVGNDTPQLLSDMFRFNPFTKKLLHNFQTAFKKVSQNLL